MSASATTPTGLHATWAPLQLRIDGSGCPVRLDGNGRPVQPREADPRDRPLDFSLTPYERSEVASYKCALEAHRRRLNRLDTAQAVADELARRDAEDAQEPPTANTPNQPFIESAPRAGGEL